MLRAAAKAIARRSPALAQLGSSVRARQQEHTAARARQLIEREAASRGIVSLSVDATAAALRSRLSARARRHGWPCKKGDLNLFLAFRLTDWEEVLPTAFKAFGEITTFEWGSRGFDSAAPDWP